MHNRRDGPSGQKRQTDGPTLRTISTIVLTNMNKKASRRNESSPVRIDDLMRFAAEDIDSAKVAISINLARGNFELAAWNANDAVRRYLERAALLLRSRADCERMRGELLAALEYVTHVEKAVQRCQELEKGPKNFVHAMNLMWPMLLLMLLNEWDRLSTLERLAGMPVVQEEGLEGESGGVDDTIMKMLFALLERDSTAFLRAQARFAGARSIDRYYQEYFAYDTLMACLLALDERGFGRCLEELDARFRKRATDKKLVQLPLLGAAGADNELVVDVWALALAQLARHRGMAVGFSSEVIPVDALT